MNSDKINEADHLFIGKLNELRSKLGERQKEHEHRSPGSVVNRSIVVVLVLCLFAGGGFAVIHNKKNSIIISPPAQTGLTGSGAISKSRQMNNPAGEHLLKADVESPIVSDSQANTDATPQVPVPMEQTPFYSAERTAIKDGHGQPSAPKAQDVDAMDVQLVSAIVCDAVQDRQHSDERELFYSGNTARVYVWMEVQSNQQPFIINHIYYLNGQKYCEVPLDIKHSRMRTWSYVTLKEADQAGIWRVEIVCNHRVMKTVGFVVKDGDPANGL